MIRRPYRSIGDATDLALLIIYASTVTFVIGASVPFVRMEPRLGHRWLEDVVGVVSGEKFEPQVHSLLGMTVTLLSHRDLLLGIILLTFSILFPILKLGVLYVLCFGNPARRNWALHTLAVAGKWSLLDVLVVAVLMVSFKTFPGGTQLAPQWGVPVFALSILLSMIATGLLKSSFGRNPD